MSPLGKKVSAPTPEPQEDEWTPFKGTHGTNMERNTRTGAIRTDETPKGPQYPDPYQHLLDIIRKQQENDWGCGVSAVLTQQEADGFPVALWGVM